MSDDVLAPLRNKGGTVDDMIKLGDLTLESILKNLKDRYAQDLFQYLPIYSNSVGSAYNGKRIGDLPPHVFAIADASYRDMLEFRRNQAVIISGESGAGKTETTKQLLTYLSSVTSTHSAVEQRILESSPILEAFGNAKTVYNDNSSRFGKFINVAFDSDGYITGAFITQYLLEKSRVVHPNQGERNYHIFYIMLAGTGADEKEVLKLRDMKEYAYLNTNGAVFERGSDESEEFEGVQSAMEFLGINDDQQLSMWKAVSAVLLLGNVKFKAKGDASEVENADVVKDVAELLGVNYDTLLKNITTRTITVAGDNTVIPLKLDQAREATDSFAKRLYNALFDWIVAAVNVAIAANDEGAAPAAGLKGKASNTIGVLDIFGFENFEHNSFEQLLINYTNERLQELFNSAIFKIEQQEYEAQGINFSKVAFADNVKTLELVDSKAGILSMLDEEARLPKGDDKSFLDKIIQTHKKHDSFEVPKKIRDAFSVTHYAGPVVYEVPGFMEKNKDAMPPELVSMMLASGDEFITKLFDQSGDDKTSASSGKSAGGGRGGKKAQKTIAGKFKAQIASLMTTLAGTNTHYVRTIKPNNVKKPNIFEDDRVEAQLRYSGMLETIRIRKNGYPVRHECAKFWQRYSILPCAQQSELPKPPKPTDDASFKAACEWLLSTTDKQYAEDWQVGHSKVFLRENFQGALETQRLKGMERQAVIIQATWRMSRQRRKYQLQKRGVVLAQAMARQRAQRKIYLRQRSALCRVQANWRALQQRRAFLKQRNAAVKIEANMRGFAARKHYQALRRSALLFQAAARGYMARRGYVLSKDSKAAEEAKKREEEKARLDALAAEERARKEAEAEAEAARAAADAEEQKLAQKREAERLQEMAENRAKNAHRRTFAPVNPEEMKKAMDKEAQQAEMTAAGNNTLTRGAIKEMQANLLMGVEDAAMSEKEIERAKALARTGSQAQFSGAIARRGARNSGLNTLARSLVKGSQVKGLPQRLVSPPVEEIDKLNDLSVLQFTKVAEVDQNREAMRAMFEKSRPRLTPKLRELIESIEKEPGKKWKLGDFAEKHFAPVKKGGIAGTLRGKTKSGEDLFKHSKKEIKQPLLKDICNDPETTKVAMDVNRLILRYCEAKDCEQPRHMQALVAHGLNARGVISIEIYSQVMKYVNGHGDEKAAKRGWDLLLACLCHFLPRPDTFIPYLVDFLVRAKQGKGPAWQTRVAERCLTMFQRTFLTGDRMSSPSKMEVESIVKDTVMKVPIHTIAEGVEPTEIEIDSATTVQDIFFPIVDKMSLLEPMDWALYECYNSLERSLDPLYRIADTFAKAERYERYLQDQAAKEKAKAPKLDFKLVFKRKVFFRPTAVVEEDVVANFLTYSQAVKALRSGALPVSLSQAKYLSAIQLQINKGNQSENQGVDADQIEALLPTILPLSAMEELKVSSDVAVASTETANRILSEWKNLEGTDRNNHAWLRFIAMASRSQLYGSAVVSCRHEMGELDIPSSAFKLFVNVKGVHFVDPETNKTKIGFKWSQVRDWLYTDSTVKIFFEDDEGALMYILMITLQGIEIASVLDAYSSFLRSQSTIGRAKTDNPPGRGDEYLVYKMGDVITVKQKNDPTWWVGELEGRTGRINSSHLEMLIVDGSADASEVSAATLRRGTLRGGDIQRQMALDPALEEAVKRMEASRLPSSRYRLEEFAFQFFREGDSDLGPPPTSMTQSQMSKRDKAVRRRLDHQYEPLGASLLRLRKKESDVAVEVFKKVLVYCTDTDKETCKAHAKKEKEDALAAVEAANVESTPEQHALAQEIAAIGISNPLIRDEIYLQVVKQSRWNRRLVSIERSWKLLAILLRSFLPSAEFAPFLMVALQLDEIEERWRKHSKRIQKLAHFAHLCMHYPAFQRKCPPPTVEIKQLEKQNLTGIEIEVGFPSGKVVRIEARSTTTIDAAAAELVRIHEEARRDGLSLCENIGGIEGEVLLASADLVLDAVSHWERSTKKTTPPLVLKRKIFMSNLETGASFRDLPTDKSDMKSLFLQCAGDLRAGRLPPANRDDAATLVALMLRGEMDKEAPAGSDWTSTLGPETVTKNLPAFYSTDKAYKDLAVDVKLAARKIAKEITPEAARKKFMDIAVKNELFGAIFFLCLKKARIAKTEVEYAVAISMDGLFVFKPGSPVVENRFKYSDISSWSSESGALNVVAGTLAKPIKLTFKCVTPSRSTELADVFQMFQSFVQRKEMEAKTNTKEQAQKKNRRTVMLSAEDIQKAMAGEAPAAAPSISEAPAQDATPSPAQATAAEMDVEEALPSLPTPPADSGGAKCAGCGADVVGDECGTCGMPV